MKSRCGLQHSSLQGTWLQVPVLDSWYTLLNWRQRFQQTKKLPTKLSWKVQYEHLISVVILCLSNFIQNCVLLSKHRQNDSQKAVHRIEMEYLFNSCICARHTCKTRAFWDFQETRRNSKPYSRD